MPEQREPEQNAELPSSILSPNAQVKSNAELQTYGRISNAGRYVVAMPAQPSDGCSIAPRQEEKGQQKAGGIRRRPVETFAELRHGLGWRAAECASFIRVNLEHCG